MSDLNTTTVRSGTSSTGINVTFLGIGSMGAPMALQLVKAGFNVTVYNRSAEKCAPLVARFSQARASAQ